MKRGRALALVAAVVAAWIVKRALWPVDVAAGHRPNVLVLVMDTTRADRCSIDGYARPTTTRLAELAKDAVVFRDAWSPANWTGPAHASLFTGLRPEHHGFYEGNGRFLPPDSATLARLLAGAGYETACFSNNTTVSAKFGLEQGFGTVVPLWQRKELAAPWSRVTHDEAAGWAIATAREGRPFLLFVNDMEPHLPYDPPDEFAKRFIRGDATPAEIAYLRLYAYPRPLAHSIGVEGLTDFERATLSDLYDAEIATLDAEIGRLLDRLRAARILDDTLVVVCADHGENLGDHGLMEHAVGLHRTLCHVPLVVRLPGRFDGGKVVDDVVRLEDVLPTVLDACGVAVPSGLDGELLAGDVAGRIARAMQPRQTELRGRIREVYGVTELPRAFLAARSVYDGRLHLVAYEDGSTELYEVASDPDELRDLSTERPGEVARLRGLLGPEVHETSSSGK